MTEDDGSTSAGGIGAESEPIPRARAMSRGVRSLPVFWIVPVLAVAIGLGLAIKRFSEEGPTIHIQFKNAEGLDAGKTKIRYKNVDMGQVKSIHLSDDNKSVVVIAQMTHDADKLLVKDTRFWVVRPRVAGGQVSGLGTLLSGSYIGMDIGKSGESRRSFVGLEVPPTVTTDEPGREFVLHSSNLGSLDVGSPVYFRRVEVGQVTGVDLDADGQGVTLKIFVRSPYEHLVTLNSRFWHASGIDVSLDATGVKVQTQSLVSILLGGVAFQPPAEMSPGPTADSDTEFTLFQNEALAMHRTAAEVTPLVAYFMGSVRGLSDGAPVDFRGVTVGEVKSIEVEFDPDGTRSRFRVDLSIYAERLLQPAVNGIPQSASLRKALLDRAIRHGLMAQLRTGNLLTGQRYVALDFFPRQAGVRVPRSTMPDEIPTVPGSLEDLQLTLANIAKRLDKVPFDQIAADLRQTMKTLDRTLADADTAIGHFNGQIAPQLQDALVEAKKTLGSAQRLLSSNAPVQQDVREALHQLTRAAASLRELTDYIERHPEAFLRGKPAVSTENSP